MPHPPTPTTPSASWQACRVALLVLERTSLAVGVTALALYAAACAGTQHTQYNASAEFERTLAERLGEERHDTREWDATRRQRFEAVRATPVTPLARLEIPDAAVSVMVLDGNDDRTLDRAVGRIPGTARVGAAGNLGIAGHRDGFFRGLRHLEVGDSLSLASLEGVAHYEVAWLRVVEPSNVEVLSPTPERSITLVTCYPFYFVGDAPQRYIVHARLVRFEPWDERSATDVAAR